MLDEFICKWFVPSFEKSAIPMEDTTVNKFKDYRQHARVWLTKFCSSLKVVKAAGNTENSLACGKHSLVQSGWQAATPTAVSEPVSACTASHHGPLIVDSATGTTAQSKLDIESTGKLLKWISDNGLDSDSKKSHRQLPCFQKLFAQTATSVTSQSTRLQGERTTLRDIVRMVVDLVDEEICPDWVEYTSQAVSDGTAPSMFSNSDVAEHFLGLRASIVIALVHTYACSGVTATDYTAGFSNPHFHIGIA